MRRIAWILAGCAVLGGLAWIFLPALARARGEAAELAPERAPASGGEMATEVSVAPVVRTDLSLRAEATGHLEAWRKTPVSVEFSGRIAARAVQEGDRVRAGALLLRLDEVDRRIELKEAEAELLKVQASHLVRFELFDEGKAGADTPEVAAARKETERLRELARQGLVAKSEVERQERRLALLSGGQRREVQAATSGVPQAEQRIERAQLALSRAQVRAPFSGRVADLAAEVGELVTPGKECLVLLDDSRLKVQVDVLESDLVWLRKGAPATVRIPSLDNRTAPGTILSINPRIDPENGTGRVTVAIENREGLLIPGLFAFVGLETRRLAGRLSVPRAAVLERQGRELVFAVARGRARWVYVKTGVRSGDRVEIVDGLSGGESVAVSGHFALAHDSPVRVTAAGDR